MLQKLGLIVLLLMLTPSFLFSQDEPKQLELTLEEAQDYALENNLQVRNTILDIEAARKKVWETTAIGLPQVNGAVDYQHIPGDLPTFDFTDPMTGESSPIKLGVKNSTTYSVTLSQLVFSGEYIVGLQASKTYLQISKLSHEKTALDTRENVMSSYLSALILERNKSILDSSLANIKKLLKETTKMYEQGFLQSTDVDQLQITYNTLLNSQKSVERQLDISYKLFKILLGAEIDSRLVLTDELNQLEERLLKENGSSEEFRLDQNIDYRLMKNQEEVSELNLKREKTKYLPSLSAFYSYQDKTNKAAFDFTINHILGVQASIPLFSSFQRNAMVQQAKIELEKNQNNTALLENNLRTQAAQARFTYRNAVEKYTIAGQNMKLAKNIMNNTAKKYQEGMASSMEFTQANDKYLQTQSDYINALFEVFSAKIALDKLLNEL